MTRDKMAREAEDFHDSSYEVYLYLKDALKRTVNWLRLIKEPTGEVRRSIRQIERVLTSLEVYKVEDLDQFQLMLMEQNDIYREKEKV